MVGYYEDPESRPVSETLERERMGTLELSLRYPGGLHIAGMDHDPSYDNHLVDHEDDHDHHHEE